MDGPTFRSLIALGLRTPPSPPKPVVRDVPTSTVSGEHYHPPLARMKLTLCSPGFDSIIDQYLPLSQRSTSRAKPASASPPLPSAPKRDAFDAFLDM